MISRSDSQRFLLAVKSDATSRKNRAPNSEETKQKAWCVGVRKQQSRASGGHGRGDSPFTCRGFLIA